MRKNRFLALLMTAVLAFSLHSPALGAGDPWLNVSTDSDGSQSISLSGLDGAC